MAGPGIRAPGGRRVPTATTAEAAHPPGARHVRGLLVADRLDPRCAALLAIHPLLLTERISGEVGARAIRQLIDGLHSAVRALAAQGIDARALLSRLGGKRVLERRMRAEAVELVPSAHLEDGVPIRHHVLLIDDLAEEGLLIALVIGSGTKLDVHSHVPAVDWLAGVVRRHHPALVFAREWERWGRNPWAFGPLVQALTALQAELGQPGFGGDSFEPVQELDERFEERLFAAGRRGQREVARLRGRGAAGAREKTGTVMRHGRVQHASHVAAWPGMATAVVLPGAFPRHPEDPAGEDGPVRWLFIDTPGCRPDPALVVSTHAALIPDRTGREPPDQARLVQWFFAHFGDRRPGGEWDLEACARYLDDHGYVTERLRRKRKRPDPRWQLGGATRAQARARARSVCYSLLRHLDSYRTGVFTLALPGDGAAPVILRDVFPPGGAWMSPADYDRIQAYRARRAPVRRAGVRSFAGLSLLFHGRPARLQASNRGPLRYFLTHPDGTRIGTRQDPVPPLPHWFLVQLVAQALSEPGPLPRLPTPRDTAAEELAQELARLEQRAAELRRLNSRRLDQLEGEDPLTGQARADMSARYQATAVELAGAEARIADRRRALAREQPAEHRGVRDRDLLALAAALADPWSGTAHAWLRGALLLEVRTEQVHPRGRPALTRLVVRGQLLIHDGTDTWPLPVAGQCDTGPAARVPDRLAAAEAGLRAGRPLRQTLGADWRRWLPPLREHLGLGGTQFRFATVDDPRLLRVLMAVMLPPANDPGPDPDHPRRAGPPCPPAALSRLARTLGEPVALLRRIQQVHTQPATKRRWLHDNSPVVAAAFARASRTGRLDPAQLPSPGAARTVLRGGPFADEWSTVAAGQLALRPCAGCGGASRVPLRLREATGAVCRRCRTDRAGVVWPVEYDRYRHH